MAQGRQITTLHVANGKAVVPIPADNKETADLPRAPLRFEPLPDDDWFFQGLRDAIAENRREEDEAENRRLEAEADR